MDSVQDLVDAVMEAGFDASLEPNALKWLSRRQRTLAAGSRCFRRDLTAARVAASGLAGVGQYEIPGEVAEVLELRVNGLVYPRGRHTDFVNAPTGRLWLTGPGGLAGTDRTDVDGANNVVRIIDIYPDPGTTAEVRCYAACIPPDLSLSDDSTLKIPPEFNQALVSGAIATGLLNVEGRPDQAGPHEQVFGQAITDLRRSVGRELRGSGAIRARVAGYNA